MMRTDILNVRQYPAWGLLPLAVLVWHSLHTFFFLAPDYLLFVCYSANLLLVIGIFARSALLIGSGFGWIMIAFPLWLYDALIHSDWEISCTLFHIVGLVVGAMAVVRYRLPRHTWAFAAIIALTLQALARRFTNETLNINAAFRVYEGWEGVFTDYRVYMTFITMGFSLFFMLLTAINNSYLLREGS